MTTTSRRSVLLGALGAGGTTALAACAGTDPGSAAPSPGPSPTADAAAEPVAGPRVLLAYFSRAGENYHYGDRIDLEVGNTAVLAELPSLAAYDVVLLASPLWNVRPPMIMRTFTDALDFAGKTVHPVVTYAVSGMGTAEEDYRDACPGATVARGLAVQGEEVAAAGPELDRWLTDVGLTAA